MGYAILIIYGERLAPVSLTAENSVAEAIVHFYFSYAFAANKLFCLRYCLRHAQSVKIEFRALRVCHYAFLGVKALLGYIGAFYKGDYRQIEFAGKGIVAAVVCGDSHDGSGTVSGKHIVAYPDGNACATQGIYGESAGKHACYFFVYKAFAFGLALCCLQIFGNSLFTVGGCYHLHILAFGRQHHESHSEDSIGSGSEDFQVNVCAVHVEAHLGAFAATYPVTLGLFERIRPVQIVQSAQKSLGVGRHSQAPLVHHFLLHGIAAADGHLSLIHI